MATKPKNTAKKTIDREAILNAFVSEVVSKGAFPRNFHSIAIALEVDEYVIYNEFPSVEAADKAVWESCHLQTVQTLEASETYMQYSVREKTLAYFYSWIEHLLYKRSYLLTSKSLQKWTPASMAKLPWVNEQKDFFNGLVQEGIASGEIAARKFLDERYKDAFVMAGMFVLQAWFNDKTSKFQQTDQAIEKSINLLFDVIAKGALDSLLDFGKFLFTQKPF
jgi:hypothetical protein